MLAVDIYGLEEATKSLEGQGPYIKELAYIGLLRVANWAVTDIKSQLYAGHGLRTGTLRRSIHFYASPSREYVAIGTNIVYAPFVEGAPLGVKRKGRFKGYQMFYTTTRRLPTIIESEMGRILQEALRG